MGRVGEARSWQEVRFVDLKVRFQGSQCKHSLLFGQARRQFFFHVDVAAPPHAGSTQYHCRPQDSPAGVAWRVCARSSGNGPAPKGLSRRLRRSFRSRPACSVRSRNRGLSVTSSRARSSQPVPWRLAGSMKVRRFRGQHRRKKPSLLWHGSVGAKPTRRRSEH